MGSHREGQAIVNEALRLSLANPSMSALTVLDQAMKLADGYIDLEWESTDPMDSTKVHPAYDHEDILPSPFGELLRKAFAPDLDPREMLFAHLTYSKEQATNERIEAALETWDSRVRQPFRNRYGLEGAKQI